MFTGIIRTTGKIVSSVRSGDGYGLTIKPNIDLKLAIGDSVAVNGICLTVVTRNSGSYFFDISSETAVKTTLASFSTGQEVNLEPAMKTDDVFGGHMVSGHVDGVGEVLDVKKELADTRMRFGLPDNLKQYIVDQGSIAIDGVSLTIAKIYEDKSFDVVLIPHTLSETNLKQLSQGGKVNIEGDIIGKYIKKYVDEYLVQIDIRIAALEKKIK